MSELAYEYIKIGDEASLARTITETHIVNYAGITGDMEAYAKPRPLIPLRVLLSDQTKVARHASPIRGNGFSGR